MDKKSRVYKKCEVCGIRRYSNSNLLMTQFPLDPHRCRLWVQSIGMEDLAYLPIKKLHQLKYICGSHFSSDCFNKKGNRLNKSAIPNLNLINPPLTNNIMKNFPLQMQKNSAPKQGIKNNILHKFPNPDKDPERFRMWIYTIGGDILAKDNLYIYQYRRVCHLHFEEKFHTRSKTVSANAVPTLWLSGSHSTLHLFPNPAKDRERFNKWVLTIGGNIIGLGNEDIYKHRSVCHAHFEEKFCCRNNRLSNVAVPTQNLPGPLSLPNFPYEERRPMKQRQNDSLSTPTTSSPATSTASKIVPSFPACSISATLHTEESQTNIAEKENTGPNKELSTETQATPLSHGDDIGSDTDSVVLPAAPAAEPVVPEPKNFTWQKPNEVVPVLADDDATEEVVDNLSMYCDDGDHALLSEQLVGNNKGEQAATGLAASGQERRDETVELSAHEVFRCNVCDATIAGFRYTCVQCSDLDLCGACEAARAHHHHYVLRVPADRLAAEVQLVLATIRRHLMWKLDPITQHDQDQDDAISLKSEVKSEEEDNDNNVDDDSNVGDDDCNETNQSPEDDVLNRSTSTRLPQHGDSDGEAHAGDSGNNAPREACGKARERNTTKIYLKLADFMALKESKLPRVRILNSNETSKVGMPNAQQQVEEAVTLSGTVAADSRSRVQRASAHSQFKKRCLSSDLSPDTTRAYSYNTHHVVRDYTVRLSTIPDATMNVRQRLSSQTRAPSVDSRDSSDEDNR